MIKSRFLYLVAISFGLLLASCGDSEPEDKVTVEQEISNAMDTIVAKLEYKPLTTKQLIPSIHKLIHGKLLINLPETAITDSSSKKECIEELAIGAIYAQWGRSLNVSAVRDTSLIRANRMATMLEIQSDKNVVLALDSLLSKTDEFLSRDSLAYLQAYYEAVAWLENLSVTLELSKSIGSRTEYNTIIRKQLLKGDDLLNYLFDYQDYPPISNFSLQLISILEYKHAEIDVTNLLDLINTMKASIYSN